MSLVHLFIKPQCTASQIQTERQTYSQSDDIMPTADLTACIISG